MRLNGAGKYKPAKGQVGGSGGRNESARCWRVGSCVESTGLRFELDPVIYRKDNGPGVRCLTAPLTAPP